MFFLPPSFLALWKAPLSGDVTQRIEPRLFSDDIAGTPEIEEYIHCKVASYGTQLDKIMDALKTLSTATDTPLPEIDRLTKQIDAGKAEALSLVAERAAASLDRLRETAPDAYASLMRSRMARDGME